MEDYNMIGKTVEFKIEGIKKMKRTGVILDKILIAPGDRPPITYYLIEHDGGLLSPIKVEDITRIVNPIMPPRGFKPPIETK